MECMEGGNIFVQIVQNGSSNLVSTKCFAKEKQFQNLEGVDKNGRFKILIPSVILIFEEFLFE